MTARKKATVYEKDFFKKDNCCLSEEKSIAGPLEEELSDTDSEPSSEFSSEDSICSWECPNEAALKEDRLIAQLYRRVVDSVMASNNIKENRVDKAIGKMKEDIYLGHKRPFRNFTRITFTRPKNCCAYLRRYAICHTGMVKSGMCRFFASEMFLEFYFKMARLECVHVVSLGGGPGSCAVGFCSALWEKRIPFNALDIKIVDSGGAWADIFPRIVREAKVFQAGSITKFLKTTSLRTGFLQRDLTREDVFDDETLSRALRGANIVMMVKFISFLSDEYVKTLLERVSDAMQLGALLMFVDCPHRAEIFAEIPYLKKIYHTNLSYKLEFSPRRYLCPSISAAQADFAFYEKVP